MQAVDAQSFDRNDARQPFQLTDSLDGTRGGKPVSRRRGWPVILLLHETQRQKFDDKFPLNNDGPQRQGN